MNKITKAILGATLVAAAFGCGGGGGGGGGSASAGSGSFFITDDLSTNYDHVWVTIKQVSLGREAGGSAVVFNSTDGLTVDLRSLRDAQGRRFKFIARDDGLSGTFNSVTVTLDDDVVLFPTGAATGLPRTFEGATAGSKTLTATFAARSFGPGNDDLIVDFDLSTWNENGSLVTDAKIAAVGFDNGLNDLNRHEREHYRGTLGGLSGAAPNQSFTLTQGSMTFTVQCDSSTRIDRSGGNGNPILANGQHVEVRGAFDVSANRLRAERVKIDDGGSSGEDETYGSVSNINAGAGTLDLSVTISRFQPTGDPVHVATTGGTAYRNGSGTFVTKDEFFALIQTGTIIEAEGSYNSGTNTLTATKLKIEDGPGDIEDNGEVKGATSQVNLAGDTFKITASAFSGINVPPGTLITVVTNGSTTFRGFSGGDTISKTQFYTALSNAPGQLAEVEGFWDGTTLTAKKCKLEDDLD